MKILHIEPSCYADEAKSLLAQLGDADYLEVGMQEEFLEVVQRKPYQALFVKLGVSVNEQIMDLMPELEYILTPTTGLNHIDMEGAKERGITVISLKGETEFLHTIKSTAEHTWMLLLALIRNLPGALVDVKKDKWRREPFLAEELDGKTLGIIGFGRLGKMVARYAKAFDMRILTNDIDPEAYAGTDQENSELDFLLKEADVVSLHIPSNEENFRFFNAEKFARMKSDAVLINTARGEVVDEEAFLYALKTRKIAGAAIDVLNGDSVWEEDIPAGNPLVEYARKHNNLLITPHMGGYGRTSIENTRTFIVKKFIKHLENL